MDRFHLMSVFVAVAEEESFAGAARRLSMSPPAVTRAVSMLEERLGVKLLNRTTRYVRVTDSGIRYLESARRIISEADEADDAVAGVNAEPRGHLAITAPVLFGRMFVTPSIVNYLRAYPDMAVSAVFLDRLVNLLEEGMDIGVRIGELPDSSMRAIAVGHVRRVVCASPAYLAASGRPDTPQDLAEHTITVAAPVSPTIEWRFGDAKAAGGTTVKVKPRLTVTNNDAAIEAALKGFGLTRLLSYQIAPYLASGQLVTVLDDYEPARLPIHILHREGRQAPAKVRSFVDLLADTLRADPALR
ncbi:LysR family transcriptional regulator [Undibacterium terreum]|uniref:LysR family transcriptional regulator n=1 Tax=Undibacterium terreum TaxID=1224302 RepID=A0A916U4J7_9BURK|nr:LysR family transcriptional regulator [Undibacterium terreum]GGC60408.1 LysR family transcriptional regulator [Undibacterium terreum]